VLTTWQDALDYLYSRANWETRPPGTNLTFELDRIRRVLAALGDPHTRWPVVHVGGTNGKGSTCALIASALHVAGYRVGLYTSPHLHTARERIQVDGHLVSEETVLVWLNEHRGVLDREADLTTFEVLTALAFATFATWEVDVAVVEVGLGGTLDTTNVVDSVATVLTPIGLDHTTVLGDTVRQIAEDKCGIIRPRVPVVSAPQCEEAWAVIEAAAGRLRAPLTLVGRDVVWTGVEPTVKGQTLTVSVRRDGDVRYYELALSLAGAYQRVNAATAVGALVKLEDRGWKIGRTAIEQGLAAARWPARFECLGEGPVLVVDGAHNSHGAVALAQALAERFPGATRHLIFGCSYGKSVDSLLARLLPMVETVVTARADHPRAIPARTLADTAGCYGHRAVVAASPAAALEMALAQARSSDVVVAAGSLFLAADVREAWFSRAGLPLPPRDPPMLSVEQPAAESTSHQCPA